MPNRYTESRFDYNDEALPRIATLASCQERRFKRRLERIEQQLG
jgi:hypothetical protein